LQGSKEILDSRRKDLGKKKVVELKRLKTNSSGSRLKEEKKKEKNVSPSVQSGDIFLRVREGGNSG